MTEEPAHKKKRLGRRQDEEKMDAILRVATFLQDDDEQITVNDLIDLMNDLWHTLKAQHTATHI